MLAVLRCVFCVFFVLIAAGAEGYVKPAEVSDEMWGMIQPHLFPEDNPIKTKLDKIFSKGRWTETLKKLEKGGFVYFKHSKWIKVVVAKHAKLPGYVLKLFTDDQVGIDELDRFLHRIWGAELVRKLIDIHNYNDLCKVPHKWLYPLPDAPPAEGLQRKHFVLVIEDMNLVSFDANRSHWASSKITHEQLDAVFTIMNEGGLFDSVYVDNLPFSLDGRIAFSDTEHFHRWPIHFEKLTDKFSKSNQYYWNSLFNPGN